MTKKIVAIWPRMKRVWLVRTIVCLGICQQNCNTSKKQLWIMLSWWGVWPLMGWGVACFQNGRSWFWLVIQMKNGWREYFNDIESVLDWYQAQDKNLYVIGGKQIFRLLNPTWTKLIVTHIHARVEGDTYFLKSLTCLFLRQFQAILRQRWEKSLWFYHPIPQEKGSLMERSIFGFFTAMLCLVCLLAGAQAFRKKRYGLSVLLWLNALPIWSIVSMLFTWPYFR